MTSEASRNNMTMSQIRDQLRAFVVRQFLFGEDNGMADDASLLDQGVVDSTGVLELVAFLESNYGIKVADDELVPDNLDSIQSLERFVQRKTQATVPVNVAS
jgi:acyl carrier protein